MLDTTIDAAGVAVGPNVQVGSTGLVMAVGVSTITESGRYIYKIQASGNTSREWGFSVGAGIQW